MTSNNFKSFLSFIKLSSTNPDLSISLLVHFLLPTCTKTGIVWQTIATIDNATISEYDVNGLKYLTLTV